MASLGDQAAQLNLAPNEASEWLIFSEADAHTDAWEKAVQYSQNALNADPSYQPTICKLWNQIEQQTGATVCPCHD